MGACCTCPCPCGRGSAAATTTTAAVGSPRANYQILPPRAPVPAPPSHHFLVLPPAPRAPVPPPAAPTASATIYVRSRGHSTVTPYTIPHHAFVDVRLPPAHPDEHMRV